jgi:ceramide glucosyltransferase
MSIEALLSGALGALVCLAILYTLLAAAFVQRCLNSAPISTSSSEAVTILKPLHGADGSLRANLQSFLHQDYSGPVQIVLGVQSASDPAVAIAEDLRSKAPGSDIDLIIDSRRIGENGKVSNLVNMTPSAKHDLLVISDADISAQPDYLARVCAAAQPPGVGLVTCYYYGTGASFWARFAAMGVSYGFLPNVVLGAALGLAQPCMGATIAIRRSTLAGLGGFANYANVLADDFALGRDVRAAGARVALPGFAVAHECVERSLTDVLAHETRWGVTIRSLNFAGYAGSIIAHPLPLALIACVADGFSPFSMAMLAGAAAARLCLMSAVDDAVGVKTGARVLLPLRDLVSFAIFVHALFTNSVDWNGVRFRVRADGELSRWQV